MKTEFMQPHKKEEDTFFQTFEKRPHHAWILKGPRGVGKLDFAKRIASKLLEKQENDPHIQTKIEQQNHQNFLLITAEDSATQSISIEQIRKIFHFVTQTTENKGWKIVVLNSLNHLTINGTNGLLKVLESPPTQTLFFLIHHNGASILPTITSRCIQLPFSPLPEEQLQHLLPPNLSEQEEKILLSLAQGCPKRLTELLDLEAYFLYESFHDAVQALIEEKSYALTHSLVNTIGKDQNKFDLFLWICEWWLQKTIKENVLNLDSRQFYTLESLLSTHQAVSKLIILEKNMHFDKRQLLLNIFFELANLRTL